MAAHSNKSSRWAWSTPSLTALALAVGMTAGSTALAQDVEEEEIVVTGFRESLAAAIDIKREETGSVDAIVAEDIADFPDLNLSEAIQRIPGVAITRDAGEGRQLSVRGLGPQFTRVRINGMEALATTGGTDAVGGTNRDRAFDFNVFASELFNSITVRKTASASIEEGSLGATIDLRTALPFDYGGFTMAASGQIQYNDLSESTDPRMAFLISNRWGNVGALFSLAFSSRESLEEGASTVRWQNGGFVGANNLSSVPTADLNAAFHPRIPRYDVYQHEQDRLGVTAALQWRPSNATEFTLSALYADFDGTRSESFLESPTFSTSGAVGIGGVTVQQAEIQGNSLVYGEFDNVDIRSELRFDELRTQFSQLTLQGEHEFNERFVVRGLAGYSQSDHTNPVQTTLLFDSDDIQDYVYDYRDDNRLPLITYGATNLTSPATWHLEQIRLRPQTAFSSYTTVQGEAEFALNDVFTLSGGLNWRSYEFETTEQRRSNGTITNLEGNIPLIASGTPIANYSMLMELSGRGLSLPAGLSTTWLVPDINAAASLWNLYGGGPDFAMGIEPALGNNRSVEEDNLAAFVQLDWRSTEGRFRGNFGLRYIETDQSSKGYTFTSGSPLQTTAENSYDDILPSLNMVVEPIDDVLFRFAAARVIARPGLGFLTPGATVSVSGANRTVTAGNPELDPTMADAWDVSAEWYFTEGGLLSFAYFIRDIDSFVQTVREDAPFTGNSLGLPDSVAIAACGAAFPATCSPALNWQYNLPRNTPGGPVEGYEISLQLPFFFFGDSILSNFGLLANYTSVESDVQYVNSTGNPTIRGPLLQLSDTSYNATVYYEDERFSARVSAAYRSDYPTTLPGRNSNATEETGETLNIDAAARFNINDNFALTFEGVNLTDEANDQFLTPDDRLSFYHHYGRSYFFGARYTY